jgi:hypothetical protein
MGAAVSKIRHHGTEQPPRRQYWAEVFGYASNTLLLPENVREPLTMRRSWPLPSATAEPMTYSGV